LAGCGASHSKNRPRRGLAALCTLDPSLPFWAILALRRADSIDGSAFFVFHEWLVAVNKKHRGCASAVVDALK